MSITGTVEKDTIKLPPGMHLPDGTTVRVELLPPVASLLDDAMAMVVTAAEKQGETSAERYAEFIGSIHGAPSDLAENLDHHLYGSPKRKP